jgi:hypothetical protein
MKEVSLLLFLRCLAPAMVMLSLSILLKRLGMIRPNFK